MKPKKNNSEPEQKVCLICGNPEKARLLCGMHLRRDEPIEEFGWLPPDGAEDFCLRFNRIAENSKTEWRFAAIGKILETFPEPY